MKTPLAITLVLLLIATSSCDRRKPQRMEAPAKPATFHDSLFASVTPTADGGAYAVGFDSGLWYLRGSEAIKVKFVDAPTNNPQTFFIGLEITPMVDGGAYAHSIVEKSFWHLREGTAERVTEVPSLSTKPTSGAVTAFPLYVAEREKRIRAEQELEERPSPDDMPDEEYPEYP